MCYPDRDYYIRFLFQRLQECETTLTCEKPPDAVVRKSTLIVH